MALEFILQADKLVTIIPIATLTFLAIFVPWIFRLMKLYTLFKRFPGEKSFSYIYGNLHKAPSTHEGRIEYGRRTMTDVNPRYACYWIGPFSPFVLLYHPDTIRLVLKAPKSRHYGAYYELAAPWIGDGLISSNGYTWARSRRLLTPAFHFEIIQSYFEVYNTAADTLIEKLDIAAAAADDKDNKVNINPLITLYALEVILKCAMSYDADIQRQGHHPYAQAVIELTKSLMDRARAPWMWPSLTFLLTAKGRKFYKNCNLVHKVAEDLIANRKKTHGVESSFTGLDGPLRDHEGSFKGHEGSTKDHDGSSKCPDSLSKDHEGTTKGHESSSKGHEGSPKCHEGLSKGHEISSKGQESSPKGQEGSPKGQGGSKNRRPDFLDMLLRATDEDGRGMTSDEIRHEVDTFMFAGHDSTAAATPWILYMLASHPEYLRKIQEEVAPLVRGRGSSHITWADLPQLTTLALCIKETMRLYPPVPFTQRTLDTPIELDGHVVPAGVDVIMSIIHLHKNPLVWDQPDEFQPERFTPENSRGRPSFAYMPFSAGSRNCIGQQFAVNELKVLIARIVHRYDIGVAKDTPKPAREVQAVLKAKDGIWLTFTRRCV